MDLTSFQRKAVLFIFISILVGAVLLARKEPLKEPSIARVKEKVPRPKTKPKTPAKIDINTADIPELSSIPGIGPGLAKQIIDYRNHYGHYKTLDDLLNVPGIGPKRVEAIRNKVTLAQKDSGKDGSFQLKINLNTASPAQLATITGIGPKLAQTITSYRNKNGPFESVDGLLHVPGIGGKILEKISPFLYIEQNQEELMNSPVSSKKIINTRRRGHEIDTSLKCPYCGKPLWEKGKKKKVYIRCPYCLKSLNN